MSIANQTTGKPYGIGFLEFTDNHWYVEKTGSVERDQLTEKLTGRFGGIRWPKDDCIKHVQTKDKEYIEKCFRDRAMCFFPASRRELPHWANEKVVIDDSYFDKGPFDNELDKPIVIESAANRNKQWLIDVIVDALVPGRWVQFPTQPDGSFQRMFFAEGDDLQARHDLAISRDNITTLLRSVLQDDSARLGFSHRGMRGRRLNIHRDNTPPLPGLNHLSAGQALLFNLFATIVRYADRYNPVMSIKLEDIAGIVLIDEIELHLHADLQYQLLPKLIKLFPKVQFIITSHSPLFLLGLENEFGKDGVQIVEMPKGDPITTERFSEFKKSYEYYKQTKQHEDEIKAELRKSSKPLVFTEGETDPIYIATALELLGESSLGDAIEIRCIGQKTSQGSIGAGKDALNNARKIIEAHPSLSLRKILLLYDCETNKPGANLGDLHVRAIPRNEANKKIRVGIENLFPEELFEKKFYQTKPKNDGYGGTHEEFRKSDFLTYVCNERKRVADFQGFTVVVDLLKEFLGWPPTSVSTPPATS